MYGLSQICTALAATDVVRGRRRRRGEGRWGGGYAGAKGKGARGHAGAKGAGSSLDARGGGGRGCGGRGGGKQLWRLALTITLTTSGQ